MALNPAPPRVTEYFTGLASLYADFRPTYPDQAIQWLLKGLNSPVDVADIGCGTGISARLLAQHGSRVIAIDPNKDMLAQAQQQTPGELQIEYRSGTGEATGLFNESIDLVVCAQSFHWFDAPAALKEFHRVLRSNGRLALMWNWKLMQPDGFEGNPFTYAFSALMFEAQADAAKRGLRVPCEREADPTMGGHFRNVRKAQFENPQSLELQAVLGRARSASYFPKSGSVRQDIERRLTEAFEQHQRDGCVVLQHMTEVTLADRA